MPGGRLTLWLIGLGIVLLAGLALMLFQSDRSLCGKWRAHGPDRGDDRLNAGWNYELELLPSGRFVYKYATPIEGRWERDGDLVVLAGETSNGRRTSGALELDWRLTVGPNNDTLTAPGTVRGTGVRLVFKKEASPP